ncbi:PilW family protein [Pseudomonas sp. NBRC 111131]|uniref:PilW family protein n=1 Tax=Pseudomonas sp. NBRC 111131 TaxID=1661046 RepID=UPI0006D3B980|nr:prepilin-type N-terminal cleavage/methylation domain-containing protein [Pseudomonas sp. NBRC 111131]
MKRAQSGFGLLEMTLALAIGLMLLAAASQLFISAYQSWQLQSAATRLQNDARLALLRMAQDIRMAGMFGCLRPAPGDFKDLTARQAFAEPLQAGPSSLSLVVAELPGYTGPPDWTLHTDCVSDVQVLRQRDQGPGYALAFPVSRHRYHLQGTSLVFTRRNSSQRLVDHVREMRVEQVETPGGQRVDVQLTVADPALNLHQRYALSVALRNPLALP